jgi:hypothetical protein
MHPLKKNITMPKTKRGCGDALVTSTESFGWSVTMAVSAFVSAGPTVRFK